MAATIDAGAVKVAVGATLAMVAVVEAVEAAPSASVTVRETA